MRGLEHKVPPPLVGLLTGAAMWLCAQQATVVGIETRLRIGLALSLLVLGLTFSILGAVAFRHAKTTVNPLRPAAASSLVIGGIYRYTRNPMYVGMATVLLGWAVYLAAPFTLLGPALFAAYITRFQIIPEERVLRDKFGEAFTAYSKTVRRWL